MVEIFILLILYHGSYGSSAATAEFYGLDACEYAATVVMADQKYFSAICVTKGEIITESAPT